MNPSISEATPSDKGRVLRNRLGVATLTGLAFVGGAVAFSPAGATTGTQDSATEASTASFFQEATAAEVDTDAEDRRSHRRSARRATFTVVTEVLDISKDEIAEARANGESLADLATANDVAVDDLVDALVDSKLERIAERAENLPEGAELPTEEEVRERVTTRVNTDLSERGRKGSRHGATADADAAEGEVQNFRQARRAARAAN